MIIEIPNENSIIKWKNDEKDEWKIAEISDLIKAYESPKVTVFAKNASKEEIEDFKQELENVLERPQGEWISVNERLPEINVDVIVTDIETTGTYSAYYLGDGLWECDNGTHKNRIIAWQPFPKPYKKETSDGRCNYNLDNLFVCTDINNT